MSDIELDPRWIKYKIEQNESKLVCPFCQQELKCWDEPHNAIYSNWSCPNCRRFMYGNKLIWQELIRTKELLEVESSEHELCHDAMVKRTEEVNRIRKALDKALHYLDAEYHAYIMVHKKEPELIAKVLAEIENITKGGNNE